MVRWKKQGEALVGNLTLNNGARGSVLLVGPANNARGAMLVVPGDDPKKPRTALLPAGSDLLSPAQFLEILCIQERAFGDRGFPEPGIE